MRVLRCSFPPACDPPLPASPTRGEEPVGVGCDASNLSTVVVYDFRRRRRADPGGQSIANSLELSGGKRDIHSFDCSSSGNDGRSCEGSSVDVLTEAPR